MKALKLTSLVFAATLAVAAHADTIFVKVPTDAAVPASTLTRAEVLADLQLWRVSGLAELERRGQGTPNTFSDEYLRAKAKYDTLRASSAYPALVAEISQRPFAQVRAN